MYHDHRLALLDQGGHVVTHVVHGHALRAPDFDDNHNVLLNGVQPAKAQTGDFVEPTHQVMDWTAEPAAPFIRLSMAAMQTTWPLSGSRSKPTSA